jgi:glyoxylate reductase
MKVFITRLIPQNGIDILKKKGYEVKVYNKKQQISQNEIIKNACNADAIITMLTDKIDDYVISRLPKLKIISNFAVGYNNIDIESASKHNIMIANTPGVLTEATADTAFALLISAGRRIIESDRFMREGKFKGWEPMLLLGTEMRGKTAGIIGAGRIGTAFAKRCLGFGMKIIYFSRSKNREFEKTLNAKKVTLNKLLEEADFISIHVPLNQNTFHLLGKKELSRMKQTVVLVNTARGEIVDEKELIKLLKSKRIFAAGFDVYEGEPRVDKELFKLNNVVLLPHIGSATLETRSKIAEMASLNVVNTFVKKRPIHFVNEELLKLYAAKK